MSCWHRWSKLCGVTCSAAISCTPTTPRYRCWHRGQERPRLGAYGRTFAMTVPAGPRIRRRFGSRTRRIASIIGGGIGEQAIGTLYTVCNGRLATFTILPSLGIGPAGNLSGRMGIFIRRRRPRPAPRASGTTRRAGQFRRQPCPSTRVIWKSR